MNKAKIKEIFASIQGEGPYVGFKQLFIRFAGCNLSCKYCDTDFSSNISEYSSQQLLDEISKYKDIHSISLTGGEPLLQAEFLKEFLPYVNKKIYLETNATLYNEMSKIREFVDIVAADIKLESAAGIKNTQESHKKFFETCKGIETFAKIVFNEKITDEEIEFCANLGKEYNIQLILQPEMIGRNPSCDCEFMQKTLDKFLRINSNVRLIGQIHKFLNID